MCYGNKSEVYEKKAARRKKAVRTALALLLAAIVALGGIFAARAIHEARLRAEYVPLTADEIDIARLKGEAVETDPARLSVARSACPSWARYTTSGAARATP